MAFSVSIRPLRYRTVMGRWSGGRFQGTAQMNSQAWAVRNRSCETQHFAPWETHASHLRVIEYSKETAPGDTPTIRCAARGSRPYQRYARRARTPRHEASGRLAPIRYLDMHHVIGRSLAFARAWLEGPAQGRGAPVFRRDCGQRRVA